VKLLLVEDDDLSRQMLSWRLERKGYAVSLALDGTECLTKTREERPDLVLLDMSLPTIDGWEVVRRLKAAAETQRIPVIALTAHALPGDRELALEAGCDEYEAKPVEFARLVEKIQALLGASS
jgi:two-component system, cell cycle response regulator DivK